MLQKFSRFIVKYYKVFLAVFAILCILSCVAIPFVVKRLNSEVMSYLPENAATTKGLNFMYENFGINADAMIGVSGIDGTEAQNVAVLLDKLYYHEDGKNSEFYYTGKRNKDTDAPVAENEGDKKVVTQCIWINSPMLKIYSMVGATDNAEQYAEVVDLLYSDGGTPTDGQDDTYVFLLMIDFSSSSDEAFEVLDLIENDLVATAADDSDYTYYSFGTTKMAKDIFENTIGEVWAYTAAGLAVIILVLFLFTKSWIDPVIILGTLGISLLLNVGSNIIFKSNSVITFACSALLQVALSVDYSVFMLHAYREECKATDDRNEALTRAIPRAFKSVFASAMTTLGGFIALFCMRFGIGADMGGVLAKGIFMSFIAVLFIQPALMIIFRKQMDSWQHKAVGWKFRRPVKTVIKYRSFVIALLLIAIFPVVLYQSDLPLNYFGFVEYEEQEGEVYDMVDRASQQLIIAVPFDATDAANIDKQYEYVAKLRAMKENDGESSVSFVLGLSALLSEEKFEEYNYIIFDEDGVPVDSVKQFVNNGYTMYTVGLANDDYESEKAFNTVKRIQEITENEFSGSEVYVTGLSQAGRDFAAITPNDFQRVTLASVLIIIFILLITFRSVKHSFILILLIEFGIWINLGIQKMTGASINFMSYIVISSVQLGATVDYAILITSKYRDLRKRMLPAHAAYMATTSSVMSVLTSATILAGACFCVKLISSVLIVSELTSLIARGAIISALLTLFILPAVLAFFDRPNKGNSMQVPPQDKLSHKKISFKKPDDKKDTTTAVVVETTEIIIPEDAQQSFSADFSD